MKKILYGIKLFMMISGGLLLAGIVIVVPTVLLLTIPEICGIVAGSITAVGLAFAITAGLVYQSNHFGEEDDSYKK